MRILILGGTAWLGGQIAATALGRGHEVTCLARGESGQVPDGARLVVADRGGPTAYDEVSDQDWDDVVDVSWQPGFVRSALAALGPRAGHWTYISSTSVYSDQSQPGQDESGPVFAPLEGDDATRDQYGEAKVACEQACQDAVGDRLLVVRSGLISGPGDRSDRLGAWVERFARAVEDGGPVLVPDKPEQSVQAIDVRDLSAWIVDCGQAGSVGVYNASGPVHRFEQVIAESRQVAGHEGPITLVDSDWLAEQKVNEWMGPESLSMWMHDPEWAGFSSRDTAAIQRTGLQTRPMLETLEDTLPWERELGLGRERKAGLSAAREAELLEAWAARE